MYVSPAPSKSQPSKSQNDCPQSSNHQPDLDEMYASLLFDQANSDVLDIEDEFGLDDDSAATLFQDAKEQTALDVTLKDILADLSKVLTHEEISKFNISRNHVWEGAKRALNRKSFQPHKKIFVKFTDDIGLSEGAVDLGGSTREFFSLVTEWLLNSPLFFLCRNIKVLIFECQFFGRGRIFPSRSDICNVVGPRWPWY